MSKTLVWLMIFAARMRKISKLLLSKQEKLLERMKLY